MRSFIAAYRAANFPTQVLAGFAIAALIAVVALTGCAELIEPAAYQIDAGSPSVVPAPVGADHDRSEDHGHGSHDWGQEATDAGHTLCEVTDPSHPWYSTGKTTSCQVCGDLCNDGQTNRPTAP